MAKKAIKKKATKKATKKIPMNIDDEEVPPRVSNKILLERLIRMEKRLIRMEKLVLLSIDDDFLVREERERVRKVDKMIAEGRIDELLGDEI